MHYSWLTEANENIFFSIKLQAFPSNYRLQNMSNAMSKQSLLSTVSVKGKDTNKKGKNFAFATYNSHTVVLRKVEVNDFNLTKAIKRELKEVSCATGTPRGSHIKKKKERKKGLMIFTL